MSHYTEMVEVDINQRLGCNPGLLIIPFPSVFLLSLFVFETVLGWPPDPRVPLPSFLPSAGITGVCNHSLLLRIS